MDLIRQSQTKGSICKIETPKLVYSTGFLYEIPLNNGKKIPALACVGHYVNEELIRTHKILKISFDNDNISMEMEINQDRLIFFEKGGRATPKITIIEI